MIERRQFMCAMAALAAGSFIRPVFAQQDFAAVIEQLRGYVADAKLPFAAIRIARHGQVLAEAYLPGLEPVGPDSVYRIYSMTKPVVAAAVVALVERGSLSLADPVAKFVPEFSRLEVLVEDNGQREPARTMTVAHLLTHSNGLGNSWANTKVAPLYREAGLVAAQWMYDPKIGGLAGFAERLGTLPLLFQPGSDWEYGYGLDIAGLVIERVSGQRLGQFLQQQFFAPLGMTATGFFLPEDRKEHLAGLYRVHEDSLVRVADGSELAPLRQPYADAGSGGLVSTLEDYGRFADMLANGGRRGDVRVLAADSVRRLIEPYGDQAPLLPSLQRFGGYEPGSVGQALGGISRRDDRAGPGSAGEYAWGGAAGTGFWATPGLGLSVTLMTQMMPVTAMPARDLLRPMVYADVASRSPRPQSR